MEVAAPARKAKEELSAAKRRLLEQRLRGLAGPEVEVVKPRAPGTRTPASAEQRRIWLHAATEPELPFYNESVTVHRHGSFDLATLEAGFNEVLHRHEAWLTSFDVDDHLLLQVAHPEWHATLPLVDLCGLPESEREKEACRLASQDAMLAFDLHHGPLFRAQVFKLADDHHWLQLTLHHVIFDGTSIYRVFVPELAKAYARITSGDRTPPPPPNLQYGDYAVWHEDRLQGDEIASHLGFWLRELSGDLPMLRLPVDRPRPALPSHRGAVERFVFPQALADALRSFSLSHGVTLYMLLLAALKTIFFRYSGQQDVVVGGLADGRRRPEFEHLMGNFLQTFAIRTRPSAERPFTDYLGEVKASVLRAVEASEVPFDRVVQAVRPSRQNSHHPFFQTFLAVQPEVAACPEDWSVSKTNVAVQASKFDLYIEVEECAGTINTRFMYNTDLFDAPTIQRMAAHWMTLLDGVTVNPNCRLGQLPLMTPAEHDLMLVKWNQTSSPLPPLAAHQLIEAQVRMSPQAVAVECEGCKWTYEQLNKAADHLAAGLRHAGARRGELVAVCLERSNHLLAALLAVLKSGAAYLPLDPDTPKVRRSMCLEDATPILLLTQQSLLPDLPQTAAAILVLEEICEADFPTLTSPVVVESQDAAYVIHTYGSTGRPKGVEVSHRALVNLLLSMQQKPGFAATDTLLAVTTVSFDIAGLELLLPLVAGGRVIIASRRVALDPYLLAETIQQNACTVLQATPATWRSLLTIDWKGRSGLRIFCGGEALPRDLAEALLDLHLEVWNLYGPTETTIWSTVEHVSHGIGPVSVGRPIRNTTAYILDDRQQAVPIGVQGELYLGGAGVANGYRGQPRLTAERFVSVALAGGARLYRTGDHAIYRADGSIEIQGRADNQVKVRGHRIELEDVEASLSAHPRVAAAAAKVWPDTSGGNRLSAYLVGKGGPPPDAAELREFLSARVPDYMIPSDVLALDAMPLTSNGKLDRKALRQPVPQPERAISLAPSTQIELQLAAIWMEVLGVPSVGLQDHFFDLGGHSLLVARLQRCIATVFNRKLAMAALFHAPVFAAQVALLTRVDQSIDTSRLLPIQQKGTGPHLFWLEPPPLIGNLALALGEDQPLLGVTITPSDLAQLGREPHMHQLAARYVQTILQAQPQGPYFLGGLCTAGILAYEVATQLAQAGHTVRSLTMLDSENPVFYRRVDTAAVELAKLKFYSIRALRPRGASMFMRHLRSRLRRLVTLELHASTEMSAVENAVLQAAFRYKPPVYSGDVLLILPSERPAVVDYRAGWQTVITGPLTCVDVQSHHDELLQPENASKVAAALARHLGSLSTS